MARVKDHIPARSRETIRATDPSMLEDDACKSPIVQLLPWTAPFSSLIFQPSWEKSAPSVATSQTWQTIEAIFASINEFRSIIS